MTEVEYAELEGPECPLCNSIKTKKDCTFCGYFVCLDCRARFTYEVEKTSIETMSVEQFMDAIKAIICDHGKRVPEDIDDMLVDLYNEYRELVRNGASLEECLPLFKEATEKIARSLDLEV